MAARIAALFLALLLGVQGVGFLAVQWSVARNARAQLERDLGVGDRVWGRLLQQRAARLTQAAAVLAADFGFRAAAASGDTDTLASALENHGQRIEAALAAMLDPSMKPLAISESADPQAMVGLSALGSTLAQDGSAIAVLGGRPFQLVMVPMKAPTLVGYVVMGFPLDAALAESMQSLTGLDTVLAVRDQRQQERVQVTTLPRDVAERLLQAPLSAQGLGELALPNLGLQVLHSTPMTAPGSASALRVLLVRSMDAAIAPFTPLKTALVALALTGAVIAAVVGLLLARQLTRPLRSLARASDRIAQGDYSKALRHTLRRDEIGDLSRAFEHMRGSIATHEQVISRLAYWDRLTGLPNRAQFRDAVQRAIDAQASAPNGGSPLAVLMLDLDRFKHVNDVLGYSFGDRLLKGVAERLLRESVRGNDLVARLSGDEFALLLPATDEAGALAVAQRVADVFQVPMTLDDHTVDVAAGFGIALWPQHADEADVLISRAEVAMYNAKRTTAVAQVYDARIDASSARSLSLLTELREAVEGEQLRLFLQPKVDARSGEMVGAEALVRWQHPARGMVPPGEFIPFAEQTGFVRHLTMWMLRATARQWPALQLLGLHSISVNLSTRDLMDQELPTKVLQICREAGMPTHAMCLEITESAIMDEPQRALGTLNALSEAGFKLSIDDFGTGYSSLSYLKRLPVNELKIDRSFVMGMEKDPSDAKIVRSTIDLAHNLGLTVVAEGVEDATALGLLAGLGCDQAQGYHIAKPMIATDLPGFASRWAARTRPALV